MKLDHHTDGSAYLAFESGRHYEISSDAEIAIDPSCKAGIATDIGGYDSIKRELPDDLTIDERKDLATWVGRLWQIWAELDR